MKPIERFSNRVETYVLYRPSYPPQVVELLRSEMNLNENSIVADVGSGTGIFAKLLLETGCKVFGVEPNAPMRQAGEEFLRDYAKFQSINGSAENTNLPDRSVDFVTAAQAFHWFNVENTQSEFRRILRANGYVVLIWNDRQLDTTDFLREYEQFILEFGTDYKQVRHDAVKPERIRKFFFEDFHEKTFQYAQTVDFEGLKGRLLSASYVPTTEHPRYNEMLAELKNLFDKHKQANTVQILYNTRVYYGKF